MSNDNGVTARASLTPTALPLADAARLLTRVIGSPVTLAMLESDVAAGAPTNADGSLNLIHYTAWLLSKEANRGD